MADDGWRIPLIPFEDPSTPRMIKPGILEVIGLAGFAGSVYGLVQSIADTALLIVAAVASVGLIAFSLLTKARRKRAGWVKVRAQCIDKEMREARGREGKPVWAFRFLCEYEYRGAVHRVTPGYWLNVGSATVLQERARRKAEELMGKLVRADGKCELFINPDNPLETEMVGHDLKDKLLH